MNTCELIFLKDLMKQRFKLSSKLHYEGEGCTVELITDGRSAINFTTGMEDSKCSKLESCNTGDFRDGYSNL